MFTLKRFIAVWEVLRHFRSIFTTTFYMLIPFINLPIALSYVHNALDSLVESYTRKMRENFYDGYDAFQGTKSCWSLWFSESVLSLLYIAIAFVMNIFWAAKLIEYGTPFFDPLTSLKPEWINWAGYVVAALITIYILRVATGMLHGIWKTQTTYNPEFVSGELDPSFVRVRDDRIAKREQAFQAKADVATTAKVTIDSAYAQ